LRFDGRPHQHLKLQTRTLHPCSILGNTVLPGSPADFGALIAEETDKWAKVVKFANIKPE